MPVREIPTTATTTLDHRAFHARGWRGGFVAATQQGMVTVLGPDLAQVERVDFGGTLTDVMLADDGTWAWITADRLHIGRPGHAVSFPLPGTDGSVRWTSAGLWAAASDGDSVVVELRDGPSVRSVTVPDAFGDSTLLLSEHPSGDSVVAWVAAGQDGQASWLVSASGSELVARELPPEDCVPPVFAPDGSWYLAAEDDLVRVSWPDGAELGRLPWASVDPAGDADGDDPGGSDVRVLDGSYATWASTNGRIYLIDVASMSVVEEVALAGHPVRTVVELYPRLTGDETPCSDFDFSVTGPAGAVLSVHGRKTLVVSAASAWRP